MNFLLVGRLGGTLNSVRKHTITERIQKIYRAFTERGHHMYVESDTNKNFNITDDFGSVVNYGDIPEDVEYGVILGGDGTMLHASKVLSAYDIPAVGVNFGRVGFITDIPNDSFPLDIVEMFETHSFDVESRTMLSYTHCTDSALNDIVFSGEGGKTLEFAVSVDGKHAYDVRGDGIIIATPTGSTAYALSAGGSIIHPQSSVFQIVPMFPQTLSCRPLVISDSSVVVVTLNRGTAKVFVDGQEQQNFIESDSITIRRAINKVSFVHPRTAHLDYDYFGSLRSKLNWQQLNGQA